MFRGTPARTGDFSGSPPWKSPQVRWRFPTSGNVQSHPVSRFGLVVLGSRDGRVRCLDHRGSLRWSTRVGRGVSGSALLREQDAVIGCDDGHLYCLDLEDGQVRWRLRTGGFHSGAPLELPDGTLVAATHIRPPCPDAPCAVGLDFKGRELWRLPLAGAGATAAPALHPNGEVFLVVRSGDILRLAGSTGEVLARQETGLELVATPALAAHALFACATDGSVRAFDSHSLQELWRVETGSSLLSSPTYLAGDDLVFTAGSDGTIRALRAATGRQVWLRPFTSNGEPAVFSSPSLWSRWVLAAAVDGPVVALGVDQGEPLWTWTGPPGTWTAPQMYDGLLYLAGPEGSLFALA
jgi:outer membrane protein assembly factor BamB